MAGMIMQLPKKETPVIHHEALRILQANLGYDASRDVIERAFFEVSDRIVLLRDALDTKDFDRAERVSASLEPICDQLGMASMALVASALAECLSHRDLTAVASVSARLFHLSETALITETDFADFPA